MFEKLKTKAKEIKKDVISLYLVYQRKDTPIAAKIMIAIVVAYALSPIDLVPDFIPVIGYLDDLILLPVGILLAIKLVPKDIMNECRKEAETFQNAKLRKNWKAGVLIILLWVMLIITIALKIFK